MAATPAGEGTSDAPAGTSDTSRICFELSNGYRFRSHWQEEETHSL